MFTGLEHVTEHYRVFVFNPLPFLIFGSATFTRVERQAINHQVISYASITQDAHHALWLEARQTLEDWFGEYLTIIC